MSRAEFDLAVLGSTPLAQLLAGLMAGVHGRKVALIGESRSGYRLPRGIDLSAGPITRPESWALLAHTAPEASRLITRIAGRAALSHVDPIVFAESPPVREALAHMRHMANGFGIAAEPVGQSMLGGNRTGVVLRDALRINRGPLEAGFEDWLMQEKVTRLAPRSVAIADDGAAEVATDDGTFHVRQAILADDEAIMAWLPLRQWPALFRRQSQASILTTPTQPLAATIMLELDSGLFLSQQAEGGVAAFGPGDKAHFSAHLQSLLGNDRQVEQAGQTAFQALATTDGAPAFGRAAGQGADVIVGIDCFGAFIAPALARWLAGAAAAEEAHWFENRLVNRNGKGQPVADFSWLRQGASS